jgi:hypothetical protein
MSILVNRAVTKKKLAFEAQVHHREDYQGWCESVRRDPRIQILFVSSLRHLSCIGSKVRTLVRKADSSEHFPAESDSFVDLQFIELLDLSRGKEQLKSLLIPLMTVAVSFILRRRGISPCRACAELEPPRRAWLQRRL